jgi:nucleotide-binding universal stress UspA family protein
MADPIPPGGHVRDDHLVIGVQPTIVCGVDGSAGSEMLSGFARNLARTLGASLELVHVVGAPMADPLCAGAGAARRYGANQLVASATCDVDDALTTRRLVPYGDPARRLAIIAAEKQALLLVVGTHGLGPVADPLVGSVSSRLAADAPCPVLVVPTATQSQRRPVLWRGQCIACGFDGSDAGWLAARHAALFAARLGGSLRLVSVGLRRYQQPDVDVAVRELADIAVRDVDRLDGATRLPVSRELRGGDPAFELERVAAVRASPVLALGSRGLGPSRRALLGTIARRVLQGARRPTLVVPATAHAPDFGRALQPA